MEFLLKSKNIKPNEIKKVSKRSEITNINNFKTPNESMANLLNKVKEKIYSE